MRTSSPWPSPKNQFAALQLRVVDRHFFPRRLFANGERAGFAVAFHKIQLGVDPNEGLSRRGDRAVAHEVRGGLGGEISADAQDYNTYQQQPAAANPNPSKRAEAPFLFGHVVLPEDKQINPGSVLRATACLAERFSPPIFSHRFVTFL